MAHLCLRAVGAAVLAAVAARGLRTEFDAVPAHLVAIVRSHDESLGPARLTRVMRGLAEPWSVPQIADELRVGLTAAVTAREGVDMPALRDRPAAAGRVLRW